VIKKHLTRKIELKKKGNFTALRVISIQFQGINKYKCEENILAIKEAWIIVDLSIYTANRTVNIFRTGTKWRLGGGWILFCWCDKSCYDGNLIRLAWTFTITIFSNTSSKTFNINFI
jgi:hypothetical protein